MSGPEEEPVCEGCGIPFERRNKTTRYCPSAACKALRDQRRYQRTRDSRPIRKSECELCGDTFVPRRSDQRFCPGAECKSVRQTLRWDKWAAKDGARDRINEYQRRFRTKTNYDRKWEVKKKYGLEWDEYLDLLERYNHQCAICGESDDICVDHCHVTGKVRGILCRQHNAGIGNLGDTAESVYKAYQYLARFDGRADEIVEDWHGKVRRTP